MTKAETGQVQQDAPRPDEAGGTQDRSRRRTRSALSQSTILKAALQEFSDKGFDGARVDEIALRSGVQKNLIYYYFKSKDGLFTAVLEQMYETLRKRQKDLEIRHMDPVEGMRKLVQFTAKVWLQHPEFLNILSSENLLGGRHVREAAGIREMYNPLLETIKQLLDKGRETGIFRPDIDAVDLYISITGLTAYYLDRRHTLGAIFGEKLMSPSRVKQRIDHSVDMILRYLKN